MYQHRCTGVSPGVAPGVTCVVIRFFGAPTLTCRSPPAMILNPEDIYLDHREPPRKTENKILQTRIDSYMSFVVKKHFPNYASVSECGKGKKECQKSGTGRIKGSRSRGRHGKLGRRIKTNIGMRSERVVPATLASGQEAA